MTQQSPIRIALCNDTSDNQASTKLDLYKLAVEMADRISTRRLTANSFFLTINTGVVAFAGYLSTSIDKELAIGQYWLVSLAGILLCYMWYRLVRSYGDLNRAKFSVIHEIEKDLPYRLFGAEWDAVNSPDNSRKYLPFTKIEMIIPWVFLTIHAVVLFKSIPWSQVIT